MDWNSEDISREDLIEEILKLEDQNKRLKINNRELRKLAKEPSITRTNPPAEVGKPS